MLALYVRFFCDNNEFIVYIMIILSGNLGDFPVYVYFLPFPVDPL